MIWIWLAYLVSVGAAAGFSVLAIVLAKRIAGVGPWLLAAVGAIDAVLLTAYHVTFSGVISFVPFSVLAGFDTVLTMLSMVLVLVAFGAMMPKSVRRR